MLKTPSRSVQEAAAECISPLMHAVEVRDSPVREQNTSQLSHHCVQDDAERLVHTCVDRLTNTEDYGERKGAAFGLAGLPLKRMSSKWLNPT